MKLNIQQLIKICWKTEKIAEVKEDLPEENVPEHEIQ